MPTRQIDVPNTVNGSLQIFILSLNKILYEYFSFLNIRRVIVCFSHYNKKITLVDVSHDNKHIFPLAFNIFGCSCIYGV
jgi:hypothetical protein